MDSDQSKQQNLFESIDKVDKNKDLRELQIEKEALRELRFTKGGRRTPLLTIAVIIIVSLVVGTLCVLYLPNELKNPFNSDPQKICERVGYDSYSIHTGELMCCKIKEGIESCEIMQRVDFDVEWYRRNSKST